MKTKVTHHRLGQGEVINNDGTNVTVDFNGVIKSFVIRFAKLKNEDGSDYGDTYVAPVKKEKKLNPANFGSKCTPLTNHDRYELEEHTKRQQRIFMGYEDAKFNH